MSYKLAIFDLDGTILNTLEDLTDSCNFILQQNNFPLHTTQEIKFMIGNGIPKLVERMLPKNHNFTKNEFEMILQQFIEYYKNHNCIKTRPYSKMNEVLIELKENKILLAVNTNKIEYSAVHLCNYFFPKIFDFIVGGRKNVQVKPHPFGVNDIIKKSKITDLTKIVFIGDSDVDIQTGLNAKIDAIGVDWGFRGTDFLLQHGAKKIAKNPIDLLNLILE